MWEMSKEYLFTAYAVSNEKWLFKLYLKSHWVNVEGGYLIFEMFTIFK